MTMRLDPVECVKAALEKHFDNEHSTVLLDSERQEIAEVAAAALASPASPAPDAVLRIVQKHYAHIASLDREAMTDAEREQTRGAWNAISAVTREIAALASSKPTGCEGGGA